MDAPLTTALHHASGIGDFAGGLNVSGLVSTAGGTLAIPILAGLGATAIIGGIARALGGSGRTSAAEADKFREDAHRESQAWSAERDKAFAEMLAREEQKKNQRIALVRDLGTQLREKQQRIAEGKDNPYTALQRKNHLIEVLSKQSPTARVRIPMFGEDYYSFEPQTVTPKFTPEGFEYRKPSAYAPFNKSMLAELSPEDQEARRKAYIAEIRDMQISRDRQVLGSNTRLGVINTARNHGIDLRDRDFIYNVDPRTLPDTDPIVNIDLSKLVTHEVDADKRRAFSTLAKLTKKPDTQPLSRESLVKQILAPREEFAHIPKELSRKPETKRELTYEKERLFQKKNEDGDLLDRLVKLKEKPEREWSVQEKREEIDLLNKLVKLKEKTEAQLLSQNLSSRALVEQILASHPEELSHKPETKRELTEDELEQGRKLRNFVVDTAAQLKKTTNTQSKSALVEQLLTSLNEPVPVPVSGVLSRKPEPKKELTDEALKQGRKSLDPVFDTVAQLKNTTNKNARIALVEQILASREEPAPIPGVLSRIPETKQELTEEELAQGRKERILPISIEPSESKIFPVKTETDIQPLSRKALVEQILASREEPVPIPSVLSRIPETKQKLTCRQKFTNEELKEGRATVDLVLDTAARLRETTDTDILSRDALVKQMFDQCKEIGSTQEFTEKDLEEGRNLVDLVFNTASRIKEETGAPPASRDVIVKAILSQREEPAPVPEELSHKQEPKTQPLSREALAEQIIAPREELTPIPKELSRKPEPKQKFTNEELKEGRATVDLVLDTAAQLTKKTGTSTLSRDALVRQILTQSGSYAPNQEFTKEDLAEGHQVVDVVFNTMAQLAKTTDIRPVPRDLLVKAILSQREEPDPVPEELSHKQEPKTQPLSREALAEQILAPREEFTSVPKELSRKPEPKQEFTDEELNNGRVTVDLVLNTAAQLAQRTGTSNLSRDALVRHILAQFNNCSPDQDFLEENLAEGHQIIDVVFNAKAHLEKTTDIRPITRDLIVKTILAAQKEPDPVPEELSHKQEPEKELVDEKKRLVQEKKSEEETFAKSVLGAPEPKNRLINEYYTLPFKTATIKNRMLTAVLEVIAEKTAKWEKPALDQIFEYSVGNPDVSLRSILSTYVAIKDPLHEEHKIFEQMPKKAKDEFERLCKEVEKEFVDRSSYKNVESEFTDRLKSDNPFVGSFIDKSHKEIMEVAHSKPPLSREALAEQIIAPREELTPIPKERSRKPEPKKELTDKQLKQRRDKLAPFYDALIHITPFYDALGHLSESSDTQPLSREALVEQIIAPRKERILPVAFEPSDQKISPEQILEANRKQKESIEKELRRNRNLEKKEEVISRKRAEKAEAEELKKNLLENMAWRPLKPYEEGKEPNPFAARVLKANEEEPVEEHLLEIERPDYVGSHLEAVLKSSSPEKKLNLFSAHPLDPYDEGPPAPKDLLVIDRPKKIVSTKEGEEFEARFRSNNPLIGKSHEEITEAIRSEPPLSREALAKQILAPREEFAHIPKELSRKPEPKKELTDETDLFAKANKEDIDLLNKLSQLKNATDKQSRRALLDQITAPREEPVPIPEERSRKPETKRELVDEKGRLVQEKTSAEETFAKRALEAIRPENRLINKYYTLPFRVDSVRNRALIGVFDVIAEKTVEWEKPVLDVISKFSRGNPDVSLRSILSTYVAIKDPLHEEHKIFEQMPKKVKDEFETLRKEVERELVDSANYKNVESGVKKTPVAQLLDKEIPERNIRQDTLPKLISKILDRNKETYKNLPIKETLQAVHDFIVHQQYLKKIKRIKQESIENAQREEEAANRAFQEARARQDKYYADLGYDDDVLIDNRPRRKKAKIEPKKYVKEKHFKEDGGSDTSVEMYDPETLSVLSDDEAWIRAGERLRRRPELRHSLRPDYDIYYNSKADPAYDADTERKVARKLSKPLAVAQAFADRATDYGLEAKAFPEMKGLSTGLFRLLNLAKQQALQQSVEPVSTERESFFKVEKDKKQKGSRQSLIKSFDAKKKKLRLIKNITALQKKLPAWMMDKGN